MGKESEKEWYLYMYNWVTLLYTWNLPNVVINYTSIKFKINKQNASGSSKKQKSNKQKAKQIRK